MLTPFLRPSYTGPTHQTFVVMWQQNTPFSAIVWDFLCETRPALVQLGQLPHQEVGPGPAETSIALVPIFLSGTHC